MKLVGGPVVSKEKRFSDMPDGYEQLEYLSFQEEPMLFSEIIFPNTESNVNRINEICSLSRNVCCRYIDFVPKNISVLIPTNEISKLSKEEQRKTHNYVNRAININLRSPQLVRFIPDQYVKALFEKGELMLSTFDRCKELENENRRDVMEGLATVCVSSGNRRMEIGSGIGNNPILLCCSSFQSTPEEIKSKGETMHSGVIIKDPKNLIVQIIQGLQKRGITVKHTIFGPCHYSDRKIHREVSELPDFITGSNTMDFEKMFQYQTQMCGEDIYFEKEVKFLDEREWRFIFITEDSFEAESIIVHLDNPSNCCEEYCKDGVF